jgi:hypothetical protein
MRGVSDGATTTLVAEQWNVTRIPYFKMTFTSKDGGTTYDFSTDSVAYGDRIEGIDHREEQYNGYAYITLNNYDGTIPDMKGYWVEIGYGLTTGSGNEYTLTPRLWVKHQNYVYGRSKDICILELEDTWARFGEIPVDNITYFSKPYFYNVFGSFTILELLQLIISGETAPDTTSKILQANITLDASDGIIDVSTPLFFINERGSYWITKTTNYQYETLLEVVTRLLNDTACYIRLKPSNTILIVYPGGSTTPDITYYKSTSPQYTSFVEKSSLVTPNTVRVYANAYIVDEWEDRQGNIHYEYEYDPAGEPEKLITGEYVNTTETAKYEEVLEMVQRPEITTQAYADTVAQAIGQHRQPTGAAGRVVVRHDCRVELYDRIAIII